MSEPPPSVLDAFGARGPAELLAGGSGGGAYRAGQLVVKRASSEAEAVWAAKVFQALEGPGFRVPRPILSTSGAWVVDGWQASEFIEGAHAGRNGGRWAETIAACRAFHSALRDVPRPAFLESRDDAWSEADRLAFGELAAEPLQAFAGAIGRLTRLLQPVDGRSQVIHGDFTANVLFAEGAQPCVIDFSPYWRPAEFALAVVISDAQSWAAAPRDIVELCGDVPHFEQWMARATLRRLWELDRHSRRGWPNREDYLHEYLPTVALIEEMVAQA